MEPIIVYRNRREQFWDDALMSGEAFEYLLYFGLFAIAVCLVFWAFSKRRKF